MANEEVPAYIGRCKCGAIRFVTVDLPEYRNRTADDVAECIRDGLKIEPVTVGYVRKHGLGDCACKKEVDHA